MKIKVKMRSDEGWQSAEVDGMRDGDAVEITDTVGTLAHIELEADNWWERIGVLFGTRRLWFGRRQLRQDAP